MRQTEVELPILEADDKQGKQDRNAMFKFFESLMVECIRWDAIRRQIKCRNFVDSASRTKQNQKVSDVRLKP